MRLSETRRQITWIRQLFVLFSQITMLKISCYKLTFCKKGKLQLDIHQQLDLLFFEEKFIILTDPMFRNRAKPVKITVRFRQVPDIGRIMQIKVFGFFLNKYRHLLLFFDVVSGFFFFWMFLNNYFLFLFYFFFFSFSLI